MQLHAASEMLSVLPQLPTATLGPAQKWLSEESSVSKWLVLVEMHFE